MELDFYSHFSRYTTVELLAVVRRPEQYQPEAVAAAQRLLQERNVTDGDLDEANTHLLHLEIEKVARSARNDHYKQQIMDAVQPIVAPRDEIVPARWYRIYIILFGIYYFWDLYKFVKHQIVYLRCEGCTIDVTVLGAVINLLYLTVVFFLLLRNKRWAWILLMVAAVGTIIPNIYLIYSVVKYWRFARNQFSAILLEQLLPIITILFLMRGPIKEFFGIDPQTKNRTLIVGAVVGLLYFILLMRII